MPELEGGVLPTTRTDTGRPWSRIESDVSPIDNPWRSFKRKVRVWQRRIGHIIESRWAHLFVLFLVRRMCCNDEYGDF